jgi:hypothetical protein
MPKLKLANGQHVDLPQEEIDRAFRAAHPEAVPAPTGQAGTTADPNIVALRETVTMMRDQLVNEKKDRQTAEARAIVDPLIKAGKLKPARRDKLVALYLADRESFDTAIEVLEDAKPLRLRGGRNADDDDDADGEFGSGEGGDEGDDAFDQDDANLQMGESRSQRRTRVTGASSRWEREVQKIAKDETKGDVREAAKILQLREPNLYHQRREEFAGQRLPRVQQKNNRHMTMQ